MHISEWCGRCLCKTATRELVFTTGPFVVLFLIFILIHDWAEINSSESRRTTVHHNVAPVRDAIIEYLSDKDVAVEVVRAVIENGQWKNPRDFQDLHKHLWPILQVNEGSLNPRYTDMSVEMVHGNLHRTQVSAPGENFYETAVHYDPLGVVGQNLLNFSSTIGTGIHHSICPINPETLPTAELDLSSFRWFDTHDVRTQPYDTLWLTDGYLFSNRESISAIKFSVNFSKYPYTSPFRSDGALAPNEATPVARFYLCYRRKSVDNLLASITKNPSVTILLMNSFTNTVLGLNKLGTNGMSDDAFVDRNQGFSLADLIQPREIAPRILADIALQVTLQTSVGNAAIPPGTLLSHVKSKGLNYYSEKYDSRSFVEVSRVFAMDEFPSTQGAVRDAVGVDQGWRLITVSEISTQWQNHNSSYNSVQRFFSLQKDLVETIQSLVYSKRFTDNQDQEGFAKLAVPIMQSHGKDLMGILYEPLKMVVDPIRPGSIQLRSDPTGAKFLLCRSEDDTTLSLRTYTTLGTEFSRTTVYSYDRALKTNYFTPSYNTLDSVSTEKAVIDEMRAVPNYGSRSTERLRWVFLANSIPGLGAAGQKATRWYDPNNIHSYNLIFTARFPSDSTCKGTDARINWHSNGSSALSSASTFIKLSWPTTPINNFMMSLSEFDESEGWIALADLAGRVIATNHLDIYRQLSNSVETRVWQLAPFSNLDILQYLKYTNLLGELCGNQDEDENSADQCGYDRAGVLQTGGLGRYVKTTKALVASDLPDDVFYFSLIDSDRSWFAVMRYRRSKFTLTTSREGVALTSFSIFMLIELFLSILLTLYVVDRIGTLKLFLKNPLEASKDGDVTPGSWNTEIYDMQWAVQRLINTVGAYQSYIPGGAGFFPVHDEDDRLMIYEGEDPEPASPTDRLVAPNSPSQPAGKQRPPPPPPKKSTSLGASKQSKTDFHSIDTSSTSGQDQEMEERSAPPSKAILANSPARSAIGAPSGLDLSTAATFESSTLQFALSERKLEVDQECFVLTITLRDAEQLTYEHGVDVVLPVLDALMTCFYYEVGQARGEVIEVSLERLTAFWIVRKSPELTKAAYQNVMMCAACMCLQFTEEVAGKQLADSGLETGIIVNVAVGPAAYGAIGAKSMHSAVVCGDVMQRRIPALLELSERLVRTLPTPPPAFLLVDKSMLSFPHKKLKERMELFPVLAEDLKELPSRLPKDNPSQVLMPLRFSGPAALVPCENGRVLFDALAQMVNALQGTSGGMTYQELTEAGKLPPPEALKLFEEQLLDPSQDPPCDKIAGWLVDWYKRAVRAGRIDGILSEAALQF